MVIEIEERQRILHPGQVPIYIGAGTKRVPLFVRINWSAEPLGSLSLSGVIGPRRNGDAWGPCGQIVEYLAAIASEDLAEGWTLARVGRLAWLWRCWHLNTMRAGCVHQREAGWGEGTLTLYRYRLNDATRKECREYERAALDALREGRPFEGSPERAALLRLPLDVTTDGDAERGPDARWYELEKTVKKGAGSVYPHEHPEGVLCKPCPECGYEYGRAWLKEAVPPEVIEELFEMPEAVEQPAWI